MQQVFRGRKHNPTQNVMAAVDFDLKFTYVLAGWGALPMMNSFFADAIDRNDGFKVPEGNWN
jgi:hypothetical protein